MPWRAGTTRDRQALRTSCVGVQVRVWWDDDYGGRFYDGRILSYNPPPVNSFNIIYEDQQGEVSGDDVLLVLTRWGVPTREIRLESGQPRPSPLLSLVGHVCDPD